ncbi:hypothetical protein RCU10_10085 [Escherichia marmotae]|nr:hypothetical protein [Escherichia marmotae]MED0604890.1 hypothetical protein [Escherichia marmotae]
MTYEEYLEARTPGSTLRGHHIPQQKRLEEVGIDPAEGTVVVLENKELDDLGNKIVYTGTRTYGGRGAKTASQEKGIPLSHSEALDLQDLPVLRLSPAVTDAIKALNRKNHPDHF